MERHELCVEIETTAAGETIGRAELGGALGGNLVNRMGFVRCNAAQQFKLKQHPTSCVGLHAHGLHPPKSIHHGFSRQINFKCGDSANGVKPYEHLKRLRRPMKDDTRPCGTSTGVDGGETVPDSWSADAQTQVYRSSVGALMYYVLGQADAQLEVSILDSYLRASTRGATEALRRVTRYLLGTQGASILRVIKLRAVLALVGYSDSDWAGDSVPPKSQSGHVNADGCPPASLEYSRDVRSC